MPKQTLKDFIIWLGNGSYSKGYKILYRYLDTGVLSKENS